MSDFEAIETREQFEEAVKDRLEQERETVRREFSGCLSPEAVEEKYKGWLPYVTGCNWSDANNGYAGYPGAVIDAVEVYYDTPADIVAKYGYQKAQYRVAPIGGGYYPWQFDNEVGNGQDGYAGCFGIALDKFQLY